MRPIGFCDLIRIFFLHCSRQLGEHTHPVITVQHQVRGTSWIWVCPFKKEGFCMWWPQAVISGQSDAVLRDPLTHQENAQTLSGLNTGSQGPYTLPSHFMSGYDEIPVTWMSLWFRRFVILNTALHELRFQCRVILFWTKCIMYINECFQLNLYIQVLSSSVYRVPFFYVWPCIISFIVLPHSLLWSTMNITMAMKYKHQTSLCRQ